MFELHSLLNYSARQTVSRWGVTLIDTRLSAQMNLRHGLVVFSGQAIWFRNFSGFAFCAVILPRSWSRAFKRFSFTIEEPLSPSTTHRGLGYCDASFDIHDLLLRSCFCCSFWCLSCICSQFFTQYKPNLNNTFAWICYTSNLCRDGQNTCITSCHGIDIAISS